MTNDANAPAQERNVVRFHSLDVPLCCDSGTRRWGKPHPTGRPIQMWQTKPIGAGPAAAIADWRLRTGDSQDGNTTNEANSAEDGWFAVSNEANWRDTDATNEANFRAPVVKLGLARRPAYAQIVGRKVQISRTFWRLRYTYT